MIGAMFICISVPVPVYLANMGQRPHRSKGAGQRHGKDLCIPVIFLKPLRSPFWQFFAGDKELLEELKCSWDKMSFCYKTPCVRVVKSTLKMVLSEIFSPCWYPSMKSTPLHHWNCLASSLTETTPFHFGLSPPTHFSSCIFVQETVTFCTA